MMKQYILIMLLSLAGLAGMAQTNEPLPSGAVQFSNQLWLNPADSTIWTGDAFDGKFVNLGSWHKVDSLLALKADAADLADYYTQSQIDAFLALKADASALANFYTKSEADGLLDDKLDVSEKGAAGGLATLDVNSKIPLVQIPDALVGSVNYQGNYNATTNTPTLPSSPGPETKGHYYVVSTGGTRFGETFVSGDWIISNGSEWQKVDNNNSVTSVNGKVGSVNLTASDVGAIAPGDNVSDLNNDAGYITAADIPVTSVNGETGDVSLDANDIGLGNVDNTSDMNKPVSTAQQQALDGKEDLTNKVTSLSSPNNTTYPTTAAVQNAIDAIPSTEYTASNGIEIVSDDIRPVFGTTSGTIAQGNDSRINNGQTAFGWGDYRQWGIGTTAPVLTDGNTSSQTIFQGFGSSTPNLPITAPGTSITIRRTGTQLTRLITRVGSNDMRYGYSLDNGLTWTYATIWSSANFSAPDVFTRSSNGYVPAPGGTGTTRYLREDGTWVDPSTGGGGGTATDLSIQNRNSTTLQIGSSTGAAATVPQATTSLSGLLSAADKAKLDGLSSYSAGTGISISGGDISTIYGTTAGTSAQGNDSRINNGQTAFSWGNHAAAGYMPQSVTYLSNGNTASSTLFNYTDNSTLNTPFSSAGTSLTIRRTSDNYTRLWMRSVSNQLWYGYTTDGGASWSYAQVWDSGNFNPSNYVSNSSFTWSNLSGKPSTFTPSAHTHNASDINAGTLAIARIPTGTTGSTVALGNHTHTFASLTSKPTTLSGYGITDGVPTSRTLTINGTTYSLAANRSWTLGASDVGAAPSSHVGAGGSAHAAVTTSTNGFMIAADKVKLNGIAAGATANSPDATLLNRANHTGTQAIGTVSGLQTALDGKMPTSWTITAGNGLTGGGNGTANRTLAVGAGDGITVASTTVGVDGTVVRTSGNQTISGTKTFSSPVVVANATNSNHAVTLGQVNSLVPESPDWTQYGTPRVNQGRPFPGTGYYDVGALNLLGVNIWANILANSFVNDGDMVEVDGVFRVDMSNASGNSSPQISFEGGVKATLPMFVGINVYDVNLRFTKVGANIEWTIRRTANLGNGSTSFYADGGTISSFNFANNILVALQVDTQDGTTDNRVTIEPVRVTKFSAKYNQ